MTIIVQKYSKRNYKIVPQNKLKGKVLKPITQREEQLLKKRWELLSLFDVYKNMILRMMNGSILVGDSLSELCKFFGYEEYEGIFRNILNYASAFIGLTNSQINIEELISNYKSKKENLQAGKYLLRDEDYINKSYYFLFIEQLGAIINMSKATNKYEFIRNKIKKMSEKYGLSVWIIGNAMIGLAIIFHSVESSNQEIKNMFIENTNIIDEPYLVIKEKK
jgi:hypothetical protein